MTPTTITLETALARLAEAVESRPACDLGWDDLDEAASDYDTLRADYIEAFKLCVQVCEELDAVSHALDVVDIPIGGTISERLAWFIGAHNRMARQAEERARRRNQIVRRLMDAAVEQGLDVNLLEKEATS